MVEIVILILFLLSGAALGFWSIGLVPKEIFYWLNNFGSPNEIFIGISALIGLLTGICFQQIQTKLLKSARTMPTDLLVSRAVGLILGLLVANLLLLPIFFLPIPSKIRLIKPAAAILSNILFGLLSLNLAEVHGRTLLRLFNPNSTEALLVAEGILTPASAKVLDTSVLIDGRIYRLLECGLIEGKVIIAQAVIDELQQLADSNNTDKRSKGRRGLKLLKELRTKYGKRLVINSTRYEGPGTDNRLLRLTEDLGGTLITLDYNLAQIGQVKELKTLNLSDLIIALRPEVQPGEKLNIKIVREGKEESQGIGYLDDGTMVVVEEAIQEIGERLEVIVTGALQTSTGRMIFGRREKDQPPNKSNKSKAPPS